MGQGLGMSGGEGVQVWGAGVALGVHLPELPLSESRSSP